MGDPNFEKPYDEELESQLANLKNEVKLLKETLDKKKTEIQEKEKECHGKDDIIQGNVEIIQGKEIIVQGKDKEIQGKDIIIKGLRGIIQRKDKEIQEKDSIIKGLEEIIQKYKEIKKIQEKNNIIQENEEINIDSVNHENDNVIHENGGVIQENDTKIQEFAREIQEKDKKIKDLELDNIKLRDEAAKYQCALGAATNFRLPDNDKNNSVIFADDIISLQNSLEEYITKCKGGIITEIDIPGVQNLLKKYGSQTIITIDPKTIIIKAVLKRHVIEKVFEYANGYFNNPNARDIEVIMFRKCRDMVNLAMDFAEQRDGVDETTKSFPIKLRQQLFATLGNRGFNNVINRNNQKFLHDFIRKNQYNLNKEINKYRKLNPEKKKEIKEIEDMAGDIIRKVVTLFWFRLRVQEPVADKFWFKNNEKIDPNTMEGKWEDNDIDNIVVDICYFPLIANNLTRQIYTPAKVLHMHKNNLTNVENSSESLSSK